MGAVTKTLAPKPGDVGFNPSSFVEALQHCWQLGVEDIQIDPEVLARAKKFRRTLARNPMTTRV